MTNALSTVLAWIKAHPKGTYLIVGLLVGAIVARLL